MENFKKVSAMSLKTRIIQKDGKLVGYEEYTWKIDENCYQHIKQ